MGRVGASGSEFVRGGGRALGGGHPIIPPATAGKLGPVAVSEGAGSVVEWTSGALVLW